MKPYADHFSRLAPAYASCRPGYPDELFSYLAGLLDHRTLVVLDAPEQFADRLAQSDKDSNRSAIELLSEHVRTKFRMTDSPLG